AASLLSLVASPPLAPIRCAYRAPYAAACARIARSYAACAAYLLRRRSAGTVTSCYSPNAASPAAPFGAAGLAAYPAPTPAAGIASPHLAASPRGPRRLLGRRAG